MLYLVTIFPRFFGFISNGPYTPPLYPSLYPPIHPKDFVFIKPLVLTSHTAHPSRHPPIHPFLKPTHPAIHPFLKTTL